MKRSHKKDNIYIFNCWRCKAPVMLH